MQQYSLLDDAMLKEAMEQLVNVFPLLCIVRGHHYILVDFTELVFRPNLVHDFLTLDTEEKDDESTTSPLETDGNGIFFYRKTGPVPLQQKFPVA